MTLLEAIESRAEKEPQSCAFIFPKGTLSFLELKIQSDRLAQGLLKLDVKRGDRVSLMVKPGPDFFLIALALLKIGAVLVLIDPGLGWKNLKQCLAEASPRFFIGIPLAHFGRILFGWGKTSVEKNIWVGGFNLFGFDEIPTDISVTNFVSELPSVEDMAAIVFTSGSTGISKGVVYSHKIFSAQMKLFSSGLGVTEGIVDLATFAPFAFFDPGNGATAVIPQINFSKPGKAKGEILVRTIETHKVTHMFGSPALLLRLVDYCERKQLKLNSIKKVLSAGATVPLPLLKRLSEIIHPEGEILTPYGATEALPITSISYREIRDSTWKLTQMGKGVCVGKPQPGVKIKIIKISDSPISEISPEIILPAGVIGEITVWGDNVSREYFARETANALHKILDESGCLGHRVGDLGYFDSQGRVWFCGRKSHRVNTLTKELYSVCIEGFFDQHPDVYRTALVGVGGAPQIPVLCIELNQSGKKRRKKELLNELIDLKNSHDEAREIEHFLFHKKFPVDIRHNSKIFREELAKWAQNQISKQPL